MLENIRKQACVLNSPSGNGDAVSAAEESPIAAAVASPAAHEQVLIPSWFASFSSLSAGRSPEVEWNEFSQTQTRVFNPDLGKVGSLHYGLGGVSQQYPYDHRLSPNLVKASWQDVLFEAKLRSKDSFVGSNMRAFLVEELMVLSAIVLEKFSKEPSEVGMKSAFSALIMIASYSKIRNVPLLVEFLNKNPSLIPFIEGSLDLQKSLFNVVVNSSFDMFADASNYESNSVMEKFPSIHFDENIVSISQKLDLIRSKAKEAKALYLGVREKLALTQPHREISPDTRAFIYLKDTDNDKYQAIKNHYGKAQDKYNYWNGILLAALSRSKELPMEANEAEMSVRAEKAAKLMELSGVKPETPIEKIASDLDQFIQSLDVFEQEMRSVASDHGIEL